MKPRSLFYRNGLAVWHGFPDITHFGRRDLVFGWCAASFELVLAIYEIDT